jgi:hypothetical protein
LVFASCAEKENPPTPVATKPIEIQEEITTKNFSNPAIIFGTDFLNFLSALKMTSPGNLDTLLKFTSQQSLAQHSRKSILTLYNKTNLNFQKKLKAIKKVNDTLYILNYLAYKYATKSIITCTVSIDRDTCRLVLPDNLNEFLK